MNPKTIANNLLIHYLLVLLLPGTLVILPPASGNWWLLKGLGALIEKVSVNDNVHFFNLTSSGYDIIID